VSGAGATSSGPCLIDPEPEPPCGPPSHEQRTTNHDPFEPQKNDTLSRMTIIVFGVAGAGKTVVGKRVAQQLGWTFYDADDFHSPENVEKMRQGIPLTDDDRWPWLDRLRQLILESQSSAGPIVLACSALKQDYRQRLSAGRDVRFVYLKADPKLIAARLRDRSEHFMNPDLLASQFDALEEPAGHEAVIVVDAANTLDAIAQQVQAAITA